MWGNNTSRGAFTDLFCLWATCNNRLGGLRVRRGREKERGEERRKEGGGTLRAGYKKKRHCIDHYCVRLGSRPSRASSTIMSTMFYVSPVLWPTLWYTNQQSKLRQCQYTQRANGAVRALCLAKRL